MDGSEAGEASEDECSAERSPPVSGTKVEASDGPRWCAQSPAGWLAHALPQQMPSRIAGRLAAAGANQVSAAVWREDDDTKCGGEGEV